MENTKALKQVKRTIISCMFAFFVVIALAVFSFVQVGNLKRQDTKADEYLTALQTQKNNLQANIENAQRDEYIDSQARENLDMIQEGEVIYYFE